MRAGKSLAIVWLLMGGAASSKPVPRESAKGVPRQLAEIKKLKLGQPVAAFIADYSAEEKESTVRGLRVFIVRPNTLPSGIAALRCDFLDGKLVYIQAQLDSQVYSEQSWTAFIGPKIALYGPAQATATLLGVPRLHDVRPGRQHQRRMVRSQRGARLRAPAALTERAARSDHSPVYHAALMDAKYLPQTVESLKAEEAEEAAAQQASRQAAEAEARRQQEAKEAEVKGLRDELEASKQREAKEAEEKALRVPVEVRFNPIPTIFSTSTEYALGPTVINKAGNAIADATPTFKVTPASVATVTSEGGLRCIKTGDATVRASAGAATPHEEKVQCRIVKAIALERPAIRLLVGNEPVSPGIKILGSDDAPMKEIAPTIAIADDVAIVTNGGRLRGLRVGATTATVTAGDETATIQLEVVRKIETKPIILNDGDKINITVPGQGRFEVQVKLKPGDGVTLT